MWDVRFFTLNRASELSSHIRKAILGVSLGSRSHGSVVSTACSYSLVSLSSCRTNREEEAKKPYITTITAASGTRRRKGLLTSQSAQKRRGHEKREACSPHPHTEERFSVTWSLPFLWFYANLPLVPNPLKLFWNLSLWLGSHSSVRACLTLHFYDSICVSVAQCAWRIGIRQWDLSLITVDSKTIHKND